mmetsp:Transcript_37722/g.100191  ORF Transcript_37722/g.100191 Transcript_37722/m.100191 type:complete len:177 (-) Transcript_37722:1107-1637(-)
MPAIRNLFLGITELPRSCKDSSQWNPFDCNNTIVQAQELAAVIFSLETLLVLDISGNKIGSECFTDILASVNEQLSLESLDISCNSLKTGDLAQLSRLSKIRSLLLGRGSKGFSAETITESLNIIEARHFFELRDSLHIADATHLDLSSLELGTPGSNFAEAMSFMKNVVKLDLRF